MKKLKVLFISANPAKDLDLDEEIREVQKAVNEHVERRGDIEFIHKPAVRMNDLILALRQEKPHILHFSGHGVDGEGELCMIDDDTKRDRPIPPEALSVLFNSIKKSGYLKLVFLNSCYSKAQAEIILEHIDYVIGMNSEIGDITAKTLSTQFYSSFATGATVEEAFDDAKVMVITNHYREQHTPELLKQSESVKDFSIVDVVGTKEKQSEENITINGDITGVGVVNGGNVNQTINKKTVNAKTNIENIDNKDGGNITFN